MCMAFGYKCSKRSRESEDKNHHGVVCNQPNKKLNTSTSSIGDVKLVSSSSSSSSSSRSSFLSISSLLSSSSNKFANFIYNCLFDNSVSDTIIESTSSDDDNNDDDDSDDDDASLICMDKQKLKVVREWLLFSPWPIFTRCNCSGCKIISLPSQITKWLNGDDSITWDVSTNPSPTFGARWSFFSITSADILNDSQCLSTDYYIVFELLPLHLQKQIQNKLIDDDEEDGYYDTNQQYNTAKSEYVDFVSYFHSKNINDSIVKIVHSYLLLPSASESMETYGAAEALVSTILYSNISHLWQKLKEKFDFGKQSIPNYSHWNIIDLWFPSVEKNETTRYSILVRTLPHCTFCYPYVYYGSDLIGGSTIEKGSFSYYKTFSWTCPYCFTFWRHPTPSGSLRCRHWKTEGSTAMKDYCCICKGQSY